MEKSEQMLEVGLELLGTVGARACSARAVEDRAGLPHGTARHYFGDQAGFLAALVDHLLEVDAPKPGETLPALTRRWLGADRVRTRARYELMLIAIRTPALRERMVAAREQYVDQLRGRGIDRAAARSWVAMLDGLVLDALLRDAKRVHLEGIPAYETPSAT